MTDIVNKILILDPYTDPIKIIINGELNGLSQFTVTSS